MSKLSKKYLEIMQDIEKHISNKEEREYVTKKINELTALYMDLIEEAIDTNSDRIEELEDSIDRIQQSVNLIKSDIYDIDDYDFEIVCPYCDHEFVADIEDELKEEIECPKCHNIIELDWDEEEGCGGCCSSCGICEDEEKDEDDDM